MQAAPSMGLVCHVTGRLDDNRQKFIKFYQRAARL
jgi:hypothetical protein